MRSINKSRSLFFRYLILVFVLLLSLSITTIKLVNAIELIDFYIDDGGADDNPGQKDLNFIEIGIDTEDPDVLFVNWAFDNTDWTGNNTGDGCALFDNDGDGNANYAYCTTVNGTPATLTVQSLYSCGDKSPDRCTLPITSLTETADSGVTITEIDPFGLPGSDYYDPLHVTGNTCSFNYDPMNCYTYDTYAENTIVLTDMVGPVSLINVCSYPSAQPNSAPSDCNFAAASGFLEIVKIADPSSTNPVTNFEFSLGAGQTSVRGLSSWIIPGSGTESYISMAPGTTYDLSEVVPNGWELTDAECVLNGNVVGTRSGTTITDFTIQTGLITKCTFTNRAAVDLSVTKSDGDYTGQPPYLQPGGTFDYSILVTNKDNASASTAYNVVVTDTLDANIAVDMNTVSISYSNPIDGSGSCTWVDDATTDGYGGTVTCHLGNMPELQTATIIFTATVGPYTPVYGIYETGICNQSTHIGTPLPVTYIDPVTGLEVTWQGDPGPVDICNLVSVESAFDEPTETDSDNYDSEPKDVTSNPTAVELINFEATGQSKSILLTWTVGSETDTLGYNLYRAASLKGPKTLLNETPIFVGEPYEYLDVVKSRNTFYYWLESIDTSGSSTVYDLVASAKALK